MPFTLRSLLLAAALPAMSASAAVDFNRDVLPILSKTCFSCHGPDERTREAKLRLDHRSNAILERDGIAAIVPGDAEESELYLRITAQHVADRMPPEESGHSLTPDQIATLRAWIDEGAEYTEHWAFLPPERSPLPEVKNAAWTRGPIDRFVLARLEQAHLAPAAPASKETLIRRAHLDLIGLPPTPAELDAFLNDTSADAYEKLIDRLLASPHYGERWGRHWLDVARFADSGGFETDIFFGHAWRYRDYVIRSFNADKPFDRFIKEQIAGDELFPGDPDALIATGLYTTGPVLQEAGMVTGKLEYDQNTDFADTTGSAFLGMTFACARCHDHKYDPISQKEYFGMHAVFAASDQFDLAPDGTRIRDRAALKTTLREFEAEQARQRALREQDPEKRADYVRIIGENFLAADRQFGARVTASRRYVAIKGAVDRYHRVLADGAATEPSIAAKLTEEEEGDDPNVIAFKAELAGLLVAKRPDPVEHQLLELGIVAIQHPLRGDSSRRTYREIEDPEAKRTFLIDYGRKQLEIQPPEGFIADLSTLRYEIGSRYLEREDLIPSRVLAHRETPFETRLLNRGELSMPGDVVEPHIPERLANGHTYAASDPTRRRAALAEWVASDRNLLTGRVAVNRIWQWHFGAPLHATPNDFGVAGGRPSHPELLDWLAIEFMENNWSFKHLHRQIMLSSTYRMGSSVAPEVIARDPDNTLLTRYQPRRLEAEVIWDLLRAVPGVLKKTMYGLPFAPELTPTEQIGNYRKWPTSTPEESDRRAVYLLTRRSFRFPMLAAFDLPENIVSCGRRDSTTVPTQALTMLNNGTISGLASAFARRLLDETKGNVADVAPLAWRYAFSRSIRDDERAQVLAFLEARRADHHGDLHAAVQDVCMALFNSNEFIFIQ